MEPADLVKLKGWRRLVQVVKDWLLAHGFTAMAARMDALSENRYGWPGPGRSDGGRCGERGPEWVQEWQDRPGPVRTGP